MIEREVIHTNKTSKRIMDIMQDISEFFVVFVKILLELLHSLFEKFMTKKLKDISGEIILITGAGHGIGRELALHYTAWGSVVVCVDINEKNNEETLKKAQRLMQNSVYAYTCDVANRDAVLKLAAKVEAEVGRISVLVNNVGIMPTHPLEQHTAEEIRRVFDINVLSHFWTLEAFLPQMKQQGRGHIICISSIAGVVGLTNLVPYCATKYAVRGMMEALHEEIREGPYKDFIKLTVVYPYMTNTGLCKRPKVKFPSMLGLLDPKEVAKHIVEAHRSNVNETTIPGSLLHVNNWCRLLPLRCGLLLKDYIDSGVESDL
ncbi:epidermal retinol dehydrogenase 2 isoform X2 [Bactrocera dorsalis]|uniref:Epidermal retinol dehydrogenase 2 isoform X2 n=1 Tax=Bactrocera dorsalis TaxID=27457 RepID=A0A6I9UT87_BACDO|nr:epidermal retinol dehydrogenase 2 isoform X2 [Bactrocera dorsalis]XP_019845153.2 epidermal retinol dehydrogenase 2 isoform X2 [Bactrocera dorsalis]XP_029405314.2 epidermal retinol dehydrogenase 2 isoform X2 [Bactrocera dorsalis]XP_049312388.1 epidermal retinol dehydrogenase 2 isoform X2 [Bactrocera dorsalis]